MDSNVALSIIPARGARSYIPKNEHWYTVAMEQLLGVVQELSHARDYDTITSIVREAARNLTGADGASFVLRDGDQCYYADENAITPLWKGRRFPMDACVSGWVMKNGQSTIIPNIYEDERVPIDAYALTFIKSMAMVPIRRTSPIGAIGNYWAKHYTPSAEEMRILQTLADATSLALENAQLYSTLQTKIDALQESNGELARFAHIASHDLHEPLRTLAWQVHELEEKRNALDPVTKREIHKVAQGLERFQQMVEELPAHANGESPETISSVSLIEVFNDACQNLKAAIEEQGATVTCDDLPEVTGERIMFVRLFQNLISNALKFHPKGRKPEIDVYSYAQGTDWVISVEDNGVGMGEEKKKGIFTLFQREGNDVGNGIGLASCKKIVELHGGKISVETSPGQGSVFRFSLPMHYDAKKFWPRADR